MIECGCKIMIVNYIPFFKKLILKNLTKKNEEEIKT